MEFPGGSVVKNASANAGDTTDSEFSPWVEKIPWRRKWQPIPVFLPGKFHGQRNLVGYSPPAAKNRTKLRTHTSHHVYICTPNLELYINDLILYIPSLVMLFLFCLGLPLAF